MFVKADFVYDAEADLYRCPAGQALTYRFSREENGLMLRRYWYRRLSESARSGTAAPPASSAGSPAGNTSI